MDPNTRFRVAFFTVFFLSYLHSVLRFVVEYHFGGSEWRQGDWLINSMNGPVRRSMTGDFLIFASDLTGVDPLALTVGAQVLLVSVLYALIFHLVSEDKSGTRIFLILSPAFFAFFWVADPDGAGRKEIMAFISLLLVSAGAVRQHLVTLTLGCLVFLVSVAAHEAMFLFAPVLIALVALARPRGTDSRAQNAMVAATVVSAIPLVVFAIYFRSVDDYMSVCQPLLDRGVAADLCIGSIAALELQAPGALRLAAGEIFPFVELALSPVAYALSVFPFFYLAYLSDNRRLGYFLAISPFFAFVILVPVALDYGRWISFHVFSSCLMFVTALQCNRLRLIRPIATWAVVFAVAAIVVAPLRHTVGIYWGGALRRMVTDVIAVLN